MYATIADMRSEGVTVAQATDDRLAALLVEATLVIDRVCGWYFEPREQSYLLNGRGNPSIEPPVPPIRIDVLTINGVAFDFDESNFLIVGSPVTADFDAPRLTLLDRAFPKGTANVKVEGLWGYTEEDGTVQGRTPLSIRRACMLLAMRWIPPVGDTDSSRDTRLRWRIIEERTRDQSYKLDKLASQANLTGDPEVDALLFDYRRPPGMGAA